MKKTAVMLVEEEIALLEKILREQKGKAEPNETCLLVKCVEHVSEQTWSKIHVSKELQGWRRLPLKNHSPESVRMALLSLYESAQNILHEIQDTHILLNTINMEIQRVERGSGEFSILMIQPAIDSTTDIGVILEYMQGVLHSCVRAYDTIILLEQHIFAVILPGASASNARLFAKRFQALATHQTKKICADEEKIYVGIATYRAGMPTTPQKIMEHAYSALQEAIEKGVEVNQISSHLLGDSDRASMVTITEKRLLYTKQEKS
ncbi:MAG: GGDEF domain-containing protein [Desulfovibrionaceae bacterium]|nr:GGDEF domain-containing protein [Desulfovibrionaceae bacterium]